MVGDDGYIRMDPDFVGQVTVSLDYSWVKKLSDLIAATGRGRSRSDVQAEAV